MLTNQLEHRSITAGAVTLHVVLAGPPDGAPVVLLHGFPECWYGWRHQIAPLAAAGLRVIVPDQRGYNLSAKPQAVRAYTLNELAADVLHLIAALGYSRVQLVGHDWGAAVAWELAELHPYCLTSLTILNVPHTRVFERALRRGNLAQLRKSWYMLAFQVPGVPERILRRNNYRPLVDGFLGKSAPGTFSDAERAVYRAAWSQPGALTGMLNWYRAAGAGARSRGTRATPRITVPTLILWGEQDAFVEQALAEQSAALCDSVTVTFFPDAGHFVQHEAADAITAHLIRFLQNTA